MRRRVGACVGAFELLTSEPTVAALVRAGPRVYPSNPPSPTPADAAEADAVGSAVGFEVVPALLLAGRATGEEDGGFAAPPGAVGAGAGVGGISGEAVSMVHGSTMLQTAPANLRLSGNGAKWERG